MKRWSIIRCRMSTLLLPTIYNAQQNIYKKYSNIWTKKRRKSNLATRLIYFETNNDNWSRFVKVFSLYLNYYVFHGRVTLFFANIFLTQRRITMKFLHNFF